MQIALFLVFSSCLVFLIYTIKRQLRNAFLKKYFVYFLCYKWIMGLCLGAIYHFYYTGGDTISFFGDISLMSKVCLDSPSLYLKLLLEPHQVSEKVLGQIFYAYEPRTFYFVRVLSVMNLGALDNYWILTIQYATLSFLGIAWGIDGLAYRFRWKRIMILAMVLFPSFSIWTSGLLKEGLVMSLLFAFMGGLFKYKEWKRSYWLWVLLTVLGLYFAFVVKYYFTIPFLSFVIAYFIVTKYAHNYLFIKSLTLVVILSFLFGLLHYNTTLEGFVGAVKNSNERVLHKPVIDLEGIEENPFLLLVKIPIAAFDGVFRPFFGETFRFLPLLQSIEKLVFLLGIIIGVYWIYHYRLKVNLESKLILVFVFLMSAVITISVPNLGSISRYSVIYMPFLLVILVNLNSRLWLK